MRGFVAACAVVLGLAVSGIGTAVLAASGSYEVAQVTTDEFTKYHPQVNDLGEMTWMGQRIANGDYSYIQVFRRDSSGQIAELAVDGYRAASYPVLNARGDIAWQGTAVATGQVVAFLYQAASGEITRLTVGFQDDTVSYGWPDLNDNGDVVYSASWPVEGGSQSGIFLRSSDGTVTRLSESGFAPRISDRGDVIWTGGGANYYDLWRWDPVTRVVSHVADSAHNAEINRNGDIVWLSWTESSGGMDVFTYNRATDAVIQVTNTRCDDYEALISDNGDIVWTGSIADCGEFDVFRRSASGTIRRLTQNPYPWYGYWDKDINANGDVVFLLWSRTDTGSMRTELFAYSGQSGTVVKVDDSTLPEWPQISNVGQVVWQGTNATGHQLFTAHLRDADGDGIPDGQDSCPNEDARGFDADGNGCLDSVTGLGQVIATLSSDVLSPETANSLASKVAQAQRSQDRSVIDAAIRQLYAFINEIEAQAGHKVSAEAAAMLIAYADNVIRQLKASGQG